MHELLQKQIDELDARAEEHAKRIWAIEMICAENKQIAKNTDDKITEIKNLIKDLQLTDRQQILAKNEKMFKYIFWGVCTLILFLVKGGV